jgi:signal transduction histidine kinase
MAARARNDYQNLKTFTENASHEMMTPLAVITSRLDTLIQDDNLNAEHHEQLYDINLSINKLSRLNQSLLLLVKIDNKQIKDGAVINIKTLINEKIHQFQEIGKNKDITISCKLEDKKVYASQYLADILLNNLLSNAIRHNVKGGQINIELNATHLLIENTGPYSPLDETKIFERFEKGKYSEGMGLGLTIARNICNNYMFSLNYSYQVPFHRFTIQL